MFWILAMLYLTGWIVAAVVMFVASDRVCEPDVPTAGRVLLSIAAGGLWPLLIVGAVEFTSLAVFKARQSSGSAAEPTDDQVDQVFDGIVRAF